MTEFKKQISDSGFSGNYPLCRIASHSFYVFENGRFNISVSFTGFTEEEWKNYIQYQVLKYKAVLSQEAGDMIQAEQYLSAALRNSLSNGFITEELHDIRISLNNNYFLSGNLAGAYKNSVEGLASAYKAGDHVLEAHFSNVLGYIQLKQKNYPVARKYFDQYLSITESLHDYSLLGHAFYNKADLAFEMNLPDSALYFLQLSENAYRQSVLNRGFVVFDIEERKAYLNHKKAEIFKRKNELTEALNYIRQSIRVVDWPVKVNMYDKADYLITAGDIFNRLKLPDSALSFLKKGQWYAQESRHREHMQRAFEQLAISFSLKKRFDSAWHYNILFRNLADSINLVKRGQEIDQREAVFQIEKKEKEFSEKLKNHRMIRNGIIGVSLLIMLVLLLLYNRYKLKQKNLMQEQARRQQDDLLKQTIHIQDEERKRIAMDLHDSLGSLLSAAKLKLSAASDDKHRAEINNENLNEGILILDEAIDEMKNIAYNIMPVTLSRYGLILALQGLFNRISHRTGLSIEYTYHGFANRVEETIENSLYRIVLESVNNILKHAGAKKISVQLVRHPAYISLVVEDDGSGFIPGDKQYSGNGLGNIYSRVQKLKGRLEIDSHPETGTTIIAEIPVTG